MPTPKLYVRSALSRSHLEAIGLVAASWSNLERTVLHALSKVTGIERDSVDMLAGKGSFDSWLDTLKIAALRSKRYNLGAASLKSIVQRIHDAQTKRNNIVHGSWNPRFQRLGLLESDIIQPDSKVPVVGSGMPKRGKHVYVLLEFTAQQMKQVAHEIEEVELSLFEWLQEPPEVKQAKLLAVSQGVMPTPGGSRAKPRRRPQSSAQKK